MMRRVLSKFWRVRCCVFYMSLLSLLCATAIAAQQPVAQVPQSSAKAAGDDIQFSDTPKFAIAGITDWTAVGGHGSDATLRTSESLANVVVGMSATGDADKGSAEEIELRAEIQSATGQTQRAAVRARVHAALKAHATASLYRLAGEADEANGDSLAAVRELSQAANMDPSEVNEFEWGSELLLHRALLQAQEVFAHGARIYPTSVRMQTALGTSFFAEARYDEAALQLCKASDLSIKEVEPYVFLGKVQQASPYALPCVESHLSRYAQLYPLRSDAQYMYAMALWKRSEQTPEAESDTKVRALLQDAVRLDPKCADGYLQLGNLATLEQKQPEAAEYYRKAIAADPRLADAYYRLAKIYARTGESEKAKAAFATHDALVQEQKEDTERQREAVKQFFFETPGGQSSATPSPTRP
jgi:tetratricopeptide (TPR) repeat protein